MKYRFLHPSMAGVLDLNTSSNSDIGLSGSFTPFVKLYDKYYFTPEHEPCSARYNFEKALTEQGYRTLNAKNLEGYLNSLMKDDEFAELLRYEPICIVEKESPNKLYEAPTYSSSEVFDGTEEVDATGNENE